MIAKTIMTCGHHADPDNFRDRRPVTCWCEVNAIRQLPPMSALQSGMWICESLQGNGTSDLMLIEPECVKF